MDTSVTENAFKALDPDQLQSCVRPLGAVTDVQGAVPDQINGLEGHNPIVSVASGSKVPR